MALARAVVLEAQYVDCWIYLYILLHWCFLLGLPVCCVLRVRKRSAQPEAKCAAPAVSEAKRTAPAVSEAKRAAAPAVSEAKRTRPRLCRRRSAHGPGCVGGEASAPAVSEAKRAAPAVSEAKHAASAVSEAKCAAPAVSEAKRTGGGLPDWGTMRKQQIGAQCYLRRSMRMCLRDAWRMQMRKRQNGSLRLVCSGVSDTSEVLVLPVVW